VSRRPNYVVRAAVYRWRSIGVSRCILARKDAQDDRACFRGRSLAGSGTARPCVTPGTGEAWRVPKFSRRIGGPVMKALFARFVREEAGQDLIEYALLAGFISLVAVAAITAVGTGINKVYQNIDTQVGLIPGGAGS